MDKRFVEIFTRLDAIEAALEDLGDAEINAEVEIRLAEMQHSQTTVTKTDLTKIKGVGDALADEILKVIYR